MPYRKKRRLKIKNIVIFVILLLLILAAVIAGLTALFGGKGGEQKPSSSAAAPGVSGSGSTESGDSSPSSSNSVISEPDDSWQLILANPDSPVPDGFTVDLTDITGHYEDIPALDNMKVDSRIVEPLLQMFQAAKADGQRLFLRASYRTVALQQTYYDWHINHYKEQGHTEEEAKELTLRYIAYPGTSEHHTGLAVDIISVEWQNSGKEIIDTFDQTTEAEWLKNNAHRFGFIMRYPKDKEDVTKIGYEPWHFRYVGKAHAAAVYNAGLCLEEYLETLK